MEKSKYVNCFGTLFELVGNIEEIKSDIMAEKIKQKMVTFHLKIFG